MNNNKLQKLIEYNTLIFNEFRKKYKNIQPGFFMGDKILFIGQNPAMPQRQIDVVGTLQMLSRDKFDEFEQSYINVIKKSLIGKCIHKMINGKWNNISLTNIVKIPTEKNIEPTQEIIDEFMPVIIKQIKLLKPDLIICLGKFAGKQFKLDQMYTLKKYLNIPIMMVYHPSYLYRTNKIKEETEKINRFIKHFYKNLQI